jgi:DNA-binding beta-propeller fold protein YncE
VFIADGDDPFYAGIRQLDVASGEVSTLLGGQPGDPSVFGAAGTYDHLFGLATDGQGNLYFGLGATIRELTLSSSTVTTFATLSTIDITLQGDTQPFSPATLPIASLAYTESSGLLLLGGNMLLEVSAGGAVARAGAYSGASEMGVAGYVDGSSSAAEMSNPLGLWAQGGNAYIADTGNYAIRRSAGDVVSTIAGAGAHAGESDGQLSSASLSAPSSIASDPQGGLYFVDADASGGSGTGYPLLRKIADARISTLLTDVRGPLAVFDADLFVSGYVSGTANVDMIDLASPSSYVVFWSSFFGNPATATFTDGLTGFSTPAGLAVDGTGNVYVADSGLNAVLEITGATALPFSTADVFPNAAAVVVSKVADGFDAPLAVALDGAGNIYIAEATAVKKVDGTTRAVSTVAGAEAGWKSITGLAYDPAGLLYVADPEDHRVRAIRLATGVVSELAGNASRAGVKTGALPGGLNGPTGLALLPSGDLAITDEAENVVLVVHAPARAVAP